MQSGLVIVGKYRLNQLLGTGGMAEVWSATNVFTEREFAVKFLSPEVAKTPEHAARFLKEAKVSARVNHPNIIDILDVGQTDDGKLSSWSWSFCRGCRSRWRCAARRRP
jgi:serine/threonine protein kinase